MEEEKIELVEENSSNTEAETPEVIDLEEEITDNEEAEVIDFKVEEEEEINGPIEPVVREEEPIKEEKEEFKPNFTGLICAVLGVTVVIVGALVYYLSSQPSLVFKKVINSLFMEVENNLETASLNYESVLSNIKFDFQATSKDEDVQSVLDIFNNLDLDITTAVDTKNNSMAFLLKSNYKKSTLFDFESYYEDKKFYFNEKYLLENPMYYDIDEDIKFDSEINYEDVNDVVVGVRKALNVAIKDKYITKGKDGSLTTYTLVVDNNNIKDISTTFLRALKKDDSFIKAYASIDDIDEKDVVSSLDDGIKYFEDNEYEDSAASVKIVLYMEGNDLSKADIQFLDEYSTSVNATIKIKSNNKYEVVVVSENNKLVVDVDSKVNDDKSKGLVKYNATYYENEEDLFNVELSINFNQEYNIVVKNPLKQDAISIDEMTEEDTEKLYSKLGNNESISAFISDITELIQGSMDDSGIYYDYDYDYDYDFDYDVEYEVYNY